MATKSLCLFAFQGVVWLDKSRGVVYPKNDFIRIENTRNPTKLWDMDAIGEEGGNMEAAGWYSLTLADMETSEAVKVGDVLRATIVDAKDSKTVLHELGKYTVVADDMRLGGVHLDFDLGKGTMMVFDALNGRQRS